MNYQRVALFSVAALVCLGTGLAAPSGVRAELPSVQFHRLQPLGVNAGGEMEVEVLGRDIDDVKELRFDHPGLSATLVKPQRFKITAKGDIPEGTYDVRLVGRFGVSNPRQFAVSQGLKDVLEVEPNDDPEKAQAVEVNSSVYGSSDGNGQDIFRVKLKAGQRVVFDCQAQKLDSQLDGNLILAAADGRPLASSGDYHGRDPFIDFVAPSEGDYLVTINDLIFRGGLPYRLVISDRPELENTFPRAITEGKAAELVAYGRNLSEGPKVSDKLEEFKFTATAPAEIARLGKFSFLEHPTDYSVAPTGATFTLSGFQVRPSVNGKESLNPISLVVVDTPVSLEVEPNDSREQPMSLTLPATVSGRFDKPRDADWYSFETTEGGNYEFQVYSERIGGQADPYVAVYDEQGNLQGEQDDFGPRMNAFDAHIRDPQGNFNLQPKKNYVFVVSDRYSRGGPRYQYVLTVKRPEAGFEIASIHSENPGPSGLNIWKGGNTFLDLIVQNHPGFNAPITVTAENLPPGVFAAPTVINNDSRGTFVFWANPDAALGDHPIRLVARAEVNGQKIEREVRPYTRVFTDANPGSSRPMRELILSVRETAPYSLRIEPQNVMLKPNEEATLKVVATRHWADCKDKINLIPLGFPGIFNMPQAEIPSGQTETTIRIKLQNGARSGPYTLSVLGQCQVPFNKDPQAKDRPNTLVSTPSQPLQITVPEPEKK